MLLYFPGCGFRGDLVVPYFRLGWSLWR